MRIIETNTNLIVKKDEALVYSRYQLNELSLKIITLIISMVNKDNKVNNLYSLSVKDFANLIGASGKSIYENLERAGKELMKGVLEIPKENGGFLLINGWVSSFEYIPYAGVVEIELSEKLIPYILEFKQKFLKYELENILPLKSGYSIRMYEILKDYYNTQSRYGNKIEKKMKIEELKNILKIPKSYKFNDIKRFILEKSKKDLLAHTDIIFNYEEIKTGRKVTYLKFVIQLNPKKLKEQEQKIKPYLKSFKTFTDYLRDKWAGNLKFFFVGNTEAGEVFFGIDKKGLLYSTTGTEFVNYNAIESKEKYIKFYKVFKNSELWQDLLETQTNLIEIRNNDIEYYKLLMKEAKEILI